MRPGSSTHRLEWVNQGNHGEEVRHKLGAGVPVVEVGVGHQCRPQGGAHELLKVRDHASDRVGQGRMSMGAWLAQPSSLTSQGEPEEAQLTGLRVGSSPLLGRSGIGHWRWQWLRCTYSQHSMGTVLAYSGSEPEGLGGKPSLQAQRGQVNCLRSRGDRRPTRFRPL